MIIFDQVKTLLAKYVFFKFPSFTDIEKAVTLLFVDII
jgi:hypothetical protein